MGPARETAVTGLRSLLLEHGVDDGVDVLDVRDADDHVLVRLRWRADPRTFAVRVPVDASSLATDLRLGDPLPEPDLWAVQAVGWLRDQVGWRSPAVLPRRRLDDGTWEVDLVETVRDHAGWDLRRVPLMVPQAPSSTGAHVGEVVAIGSGQVPLVPVPDPGRQLAGLGFEIATPRRWHDAGDLLAWVAVARDERADPSGYLAAGRDPLSPELAHLDGELDAVDPDGRRPLLRMVLADAAAAGVERIVAMLDLDVFDELGFTPPDADGRRFAAVVDL